MGLLLRYGKFEGKWVVVSDVQTAPILFVHKRVFHQKEFNKPGKIYKKHVDNSGKIYYGYLVSDMSLPYETVHRGNVISQLIFIIYLFYNSMMSNGLSAVFHQE